MDATSLVPKALCPSCGSRQIEETPFRNDSAIMCRCLRCLAVFRLSILVPAEVPAAVT